jgi:2-succinyl-5-enolpyruvyl-6-hydroxy-3-cyclohexene-1-carboxylate synthase
MPIRDMDMYACSFGAAVAVAANRGASGIDGTIASAAGFVAGLDAPVTLVIGDLAFLHDLNSLSLLKSISRPLIIVLLNNRGGGIFSFLPIARYDDVFETYFGTPHQFDFKSAAKMFDIEYYQPQDNASLVEIYSASQEEKKSTIIEIRTDRKENRKLHAQLQAEIVARIK